jgi:hypothetical protein
MTGWRKGTNMETFETGTKVETPMGSGVVAGSTQDGKLVVQLDADKYRYESRETDIIDTVAFWPGEVREV